VWFGSVERGAGKCSEAPLPADLSRAILHRSNKRDRTWAVCTRSAPRKALFFSSFSQVPAEAGGE